MALLRLFRSLFGDRGVHEQRFPITAGLVVLMAVMLLLIPYIWLICAALAALVHELGHIVAIWLFTGKKPESIFHARFAGITLPALHRGAELICTLAGPAAGLMLLLIAPRGSPLAICVVVQTLFNLFPIYPLDGGRALRCVLDMTLQPPKAELVSKIVANIFRSVIVIWAIFVTFHRDYGFVPLFVAGIVLVPRK